ncbi:MAG: hypothetical protein JXR68_10325 [Bacteroidales bacterium]|nr:hypothetical protein [Bacteroidales bacterium]
MRQLFLFIVFMMLSLVIVNCENTNKDREMFFEYLKSTDISNLSNNFVVVVIPDHACQSCQMDALEYLQILSKKNSIFILTQFQSEKAWRVKLDNYVHTQNLIFDKENRFSEIFNVGYYPKLILISKNDFNVNELTFENKNSLKRLILDFVYEAE